MLKRSIIGALATIVAATATLVAGPAAPAQAACLLDARRVADRGTHRDRRALLTRRRQRVRRPHLLATPQPELGWDKAGQPRRPGVRSGRKAGLTLVNVRFEMYPGRLRPLRRVGATSAASTSRPLRAAAISARSCMPVPGERGAFRIDGDILSSTPVGTDRVIVDAFQIETGMQQNGVVAYGAFGSSHNKGNKWTAGVGWTGRYMMFVTDKATGNKISAIVDITPNTIPAVDLDAICFGFDTCSYLSGGPGTTAGTFHATAPTRILDTRNDDRASCGPVRTGDGRHPSPDPITRRGRDRQPRSAGHRPERHPVERRVSGAAQRHGGQRRNAGTGLDVGDPETGPGGRRLQRPGFVRRVSEHVEPQHRGRQPHPEPRARPGRRRRQDPHLRLCRADTRDRRRRRVVRNRRGAPRRHGILGCRAEPGARQSGRHRITGVAVRSG